MIDITDFYMLCKWENLQNHLFIQYLFSPLYIKFTHHIFFYQFQC